VVGLDGYGLRIAERVESLTPPNKKSARYLLDMEQPLAAWLAKPQAACVG
jgi:hypothetical protein